MIGEDFTCEGCGQTFQKARPDDQVAAEFASNFPGEDISLGAVVCDDCYEAMSPLIGGDDDLGDAIEMLMEKLEAAAKREREEYLATLPTDFDRMVATHLLDETLAIESRAGELVFLHGMDVETAVEQAASERKAAGQ